MAQPAAAVEVRVTHAFASPPERVFDSWLDPASLGQWMFGPAVRDEEVVGISIDPRPGGGFSIRVRRKGRELNHAGRYLVIDRPRRLVFTWNVAPTDGDLSRVTIEIVPRGDGCELSLVHQLHPDWSDIAAQAEKAWRLELECLARTL
jgi:uncharacterized protein YndB with AHSA1/START domain